MRGHTGRAPKRRRGPPFSPLMQRHDPGYGRGEHAITSSAAHAALGGDGLVSHLEAVFASEAYRPPMLPVVALEVHALTRRADVPLHRFVTLIERDPILAAAVLKAAQSPAYAARVPPRTLDDVVARMGLDNLRDLVWEAAAGKVFRAPGYQDAMASVRRHSVAVARIARSLSDQTSIPRDQAFLCGLLHDAGFVAALLALGELPRAEQPALRDVVHELDGLHEAAGLRVAALWKLPMDVQLVLGHHHLPRIGSHPHPLAAIVTLAGHLASATGLAIELAPGIPVDVVEPHALTFAREALSLGPRQMESAAADAVVLCASEDLAA